MDQPTGPIIDFLGDPLLPTESQEHVMAVPAVSFPKDPLSQLPLDKVFGHVRYSKADILTLRGVLGYSSQELGDHWQVQLEKG